MKTLVVYYSHKGNNRFLAKRIAARLSCELEEIKPRLNIFMFFLMNLSLGIRSLKKKTGDYDTIILVGPVFVGRLIAPLKDFMIRYSKDIRKLVFVTVCGSNFEQKDQKFGHGIVFQKVRGIMGEKCIHCEAFPISLVVPEDQKANGDAVIKTRLTDENFKGEITERFENFLRNPAFA